MRWSLGAGLTRRCRFLGRRTISRRGAVQMGKSTKNLRFEDAMKRLDAIVAAMESGEIGIEESLAKYEEAMQLAARCRQILDPGRAAHPKDPARRARPADRGTLRADDTRRRGRTVGFGRLGEAPGGRHGHRHRKPDAQHHRPAPRRAGRGNAPDMRRLRRVGSVRRRARVPELSGRADRDHAGQLLPALRAHHAPQPPSTTAAVSVADPRASGTWRAWSAWGHTSRRCESSPPG